MAQIIRAITIDVSQPNNLRAITAKQNDLNSRFLQINITDEGAPIKVNKSSQVIMNVKRTDNTVRMFYGSVNDDGSVTVPLTSWMLELEGSINCDVSIVSTEDLQKLTSMQFSIYVEAAVFPQSDLEDSENYDVLVDLLGAAEDAAACVEATEEANEAAARANAAADGVVIVEQNSKSPLTFWVGTQAEYDALAEKDMSCFYIISDDSDLEAIYRAINKVASDVLQMHTPYDISSAIVIESPKVTSYTLFKCGKMLSLTCDITVDRGLDPGDIIATIRGYAPTQTVYAQTADYGGYWICISLEPDETGKNTLIKVAHWCNNVNNSNTRHFFETFICK